MTTVRLVPAGTPVLLGPGLPPLLTGGGGADPEPDEWVGGGAAIDVLGGAGFELDTGAALLEDTATGGEVSIDGPGSLGCADADDPPATGR